MTEDVMIAAASGAAGGVLLLLIVLRINVSRRPIIRLLSKWTRLAAPKAAVVVAGLTAVSVTSLSSAIPADISRVLTRQIEQRQYSETAAILAAAPGAPAKAAPAIGLLSGVNAVGDDAGRKQQALTSLRDFAGRVEAKRSMIASLGNDSAEAPHTGALADVDTMIERLRTRLQSDAGDLKGWMTLGWSYASTGQYREAVSAYEAALKLDSGNSEIKTALDDAKSKLAANAKTAE